MSDDFNIKIDLSGLGEQITKERHETLYRDMLAAILQDITENDPTLTDEQIKGIALPIAAGLRKTIYESASITLETLKVIANAHFKGGPWAT